MTNNKPYHIEKIALDMTKERAVLYPYALIYKMSEVYLGKTAEIEDKWNEMLEARFFSKDGEVHIFRCEKEWKAIEITDNGNSEDTRIRRYGLAKRFMSAGKYLLVKDYLTEDEDGQVYVDQTRLCGIGGGREDG